MVSEFDLIRKYFTKPINHTLLGGGDDCALVKVSDGMALAISTDMLVSGTHFFSDVDPVQLGHKVLAVNLSDIAAMGGSPRWCTLAAALPGIDEDWIKAFADGFFALADRFNVELIGGDTTRGPLNFCVQIMGEVLAGKALKRSSAKVGDDIWVSGELGDAALMLKHLQGQIVLSEQALQLCSPRLHTPEPKVNLGLALVEIASSCIDISDGLLADLRHILEASQVGADIRIDLVPHSRVLSDCENKDTQQHCLLAGGDDYELCFTAPRKYNDSIASLSNSLKQKLTCIGTITSDLGLRARDHNQNIVNISAKGFDHFA